MNEFYRMNQLIGSVADYAANDLVLGSGEIALAIQEGGEILGKIGDGSSKFSELEYVIGTSAIPLAGTEAGKPVTGIVTYANATINKEFTIGIVEGLGIDDFVIGASGGNVAQSNIWVTIDSHNWTFRPDGRLVGPDVVYGAFDGLTYANKDYVDLAVSGGVSADYVPLAGTNGVPVTGTIEWYNATVDKDYALGIVSGFGVDNLLLSASDATNKINCSFWIDMNDYIWKFENTGRLRMPDITYGVGDDLAAANKKYVDSKIVQLEAKLAAAEITL